MHDLGENSFCGLAFQLEAISRGTWNRSESETDLREPGQYPWVRGGYLSKARTSQRKNLCACWDVGSSRELCSRRLGVVSAILPLARTVSPEQPSHAQPYTREFKKRDDISCTAVLWLKSSSPGFQGKLFEKGESLMEKTEALIYVALPALTLFWWLRKSPSCPARWRPSPRITLLGIVHAQTFVKLCRAKPCRTLEHRLLMCWKMLKMCLFPQI